MADPATVLPILATPLGRVTVASPDELNRSLIGLLTEQRARDRARQANPLLYRTADDLFERPEAPVRQLATEILRGAYSVISSINELSEEQIQALRVQTRGWFTMVSQNGCIPAGNHPLSAWCVIYCIGTPAASATRADSGALRFYQSGFGTMLQDATNAQLRMPFITGHYTWRPTAGEMVVFPASTLHEIALSHTPGDLVLASARLRFVAAGQTGLPQW